MWPIERTGSVPEGQLALSLSGESQLVLQLALEEASTIGRGGQYIDTGDLLVGLSQVGEVGEKLRTFGVDVNKIRATRELIGGNADLNRLRPPLPKTAIERWTQLPRTIRLQKIGQMVTRKAVLGNKDVVEPNDILATIVEEGEGVGAKVLRSLGFNKQTLEENQLL